jgi:hypothetical protein
LEVLLQRGANHVGSPLKLVSLSNEELSNLIYAVVSFGRMPWYTDDLPTKIPRALGLWSLLIRLTDWIYWNVAELMV